MIEVSPAVAVWYFLFLVELLLTLSWWRPLFQTGLPVRRRTLAATSLPTTDLLVEKWIRKWEEESPGLAFKLHEDEILIRSRFALSYTPFLRGRVSQVHTLPTLQVYIQWWVLLVLGLVLGLPNPTAFLERVPIAVVGTAILLLFVVRELRVYRNVAASPEVGPHPPTRQHGQHPSL